MNAVDRVAGTVRKLDTMNDLKTKYGDRLWLANLDMTDAPAIKQVVEKAFADLGTIEVIVSNAGYGLFGAAESLSDEQIIQQIGTNLVGPIQLVSRYLEEKAKLAEERRKLEVERAELEKVRTKVRTEQEEPADRPEQKKLAVQ